VYVWVMTTVDTVKDVLSVDVAVMEEHGVVAEVDETTSEDESSLDEGVGVGVAVLLGIDVLETRLL